MRPHAAATVAAAAAFVALTTLHFAVGRETHGLHVLHVVFGMLYLVPIVAAAVWGGPHAGVALGMASAAAYVLHARTSWAGEPMENVNQLALAATFAFVSITTAALAHARDREHQRARQTELRLQRDAAIHAIASLSTALRRRDDRTGEHCERVARLAVDLGGALGLTPEVIERLRLAGLVHDVGKIGVPDDVLFKPGALTDDERQRMVRHPAIASEILAPLAGAASIAELVLSHHEAPDGSGYPRGLSGEQLSLEARVLHVTDAFDALVAERPYKAARSPVDALATLRAAPEKFDAACVEALAKLVSARWGS